MSFNQQILGKRLREARENCGLSQQVAADSINVPRTAITQLEAGNRAVSTLELAQLAELYRQPVANFFRKEPLLDDDLLIVLNQLAPGLAAHTDIKHQIEQRLDLCREGHSLKNLLGCFPRCSPPTYLLPAPQTPSEAVRQGEQVACQERKRLGLSDLSIADMAKLLSNQEIWSFGIHLPQAISGLSLHHPSLGLAIVVNFAYVRARQRFSYAHEYAHTLLDRDRIAIVSTQDNASELIEIRANAFATAFLMPSEGITAFLRSLDKGLPSRYEHAIFDVATEGRIDTQVRPLPGSQTITPQDLALLAQHFGVSYQAAAYRLKNLNTISQLECTYLLERESEGKAYLEFLKMLDDLDQPESQERQDREIRSRIIHLALEAYRRELVSHGKLLDISKKLGLPGQKIIELAEAVKENSSNM